MTGRIYKALSGFYYVDTGDALLTCKARGKFRKTGVSPLVGDRVECTVLSGGEGVIEAILPRRNAFERPAVANIDQLVIVASEAIPRTEPYLIDRMTAIAALKGCDVLVCVNKCDLRTSAILPPARNCLTIINGPDIRSCASAPRQEKGWMILFARYPAS